MNTLSSVRMGASLLVMLAALAFTATGFAATAAAPVNTAPPTISGTTQVGQTLTAGNGTWSNAPTSSAYQWLRCNGGGNACVSVANGTQRTYTLVGADAGRTIRVRVTATEADGSGCSRVEPNRGDHPGQIPLRGPRTRHCRQSPAPQRSVRR